MAGRGSGATKSRTTTTGKKSTTETLTQLRDEAKRLGIVGRYRMDRKALQAAISRHESAPKKTTKKSSTGKRRSPATTEKKESKRTKKTKTTKRTKKSSSKRPARKQLTTSTGKLKFINPETGGIIAEGTEPYVDLLKRRLQPIPKTESKVRISDKEKDRLWEECGQDAFLSTDNSRRYPIIRPADATKRSCPIDYNLVEQALRRAKINVGRIRNGTMSRDPVHQQVLDDATEMLIQHSKQLYKSES